MLKRVILPFAFILAAALLRFWLTPLATRLPAGYTNETFYAADDRWRNTPDGDWVAIHSSGQRIDLALTALNDATILQSDLHWYTDSGQVIFESTGLYGVDRRTRANLPTYGDRARTGQFLFPAHVAQTAYTLWDAMFIGPRTATYDHTETLDGLQVYVFKFRGEGMDESAGYSALPGVPERYHTYTDGQGTLWIEPVSGIVVDYLEQGVSYFTNPTSAERLADFHQWSDRYTAESKATQLNLARSARQRILTLEIWLPVGFLLVGLVGSGISIVCARRLKKDAGATS